MKKILLLCAIMLLSLPGWASTQIGKLYYDLNSSSMTASVACSVLGSPNANYVSGDLVIPESVTYMGKKYTVTSIGIYAFVYCSGLTSVVIPNSVTYIGEYAFRGCSGLKNAPIPNKVTYIGNAAFYDCNSLTSVEIPDSVTYIGNYAFQNCSSLTSVTLGNSVTYIGNSAFSGCSGLTRVTIPNTVTSIGDYAFGGCSGLTRVDISDLAAWCNINFGLESANPLAYANRLYLNNIEITDLKIPDSVTSIPKYAFYKCTGLTSVDIPNTVTSIGALAFHGCTGLTSVTIPNSVTEIAVRSFDACTGITNVSIGNSVTEVGNNAFSGCPVETLSIDCKKVENWFAGKSSIKNLTIGNSVIEIGEYAFRYCSGLTSVVIPNSVTSIGNYAFQNCNSLTSMSIPNTVTEIGNYAFQNCSSLASVTIPNKVTSIEEYVFSDCTSLTSIEIPNSVISIGKYAFQECNGLTSVKIGNSVAEIGENAFTNCNNLTRVDISDLKSWCNIYFGNEFANPLSYANILYLNNVVITDLTIPDGVSSIKNYAFTGGGSLTSVIISSAVTSIGNSAFAGCSGLTSVEIPNSVTLIGNSAFNGCKIVTLKIDCSTIKNWFSGLENLKTLILGNSASSIEANAFQNCSGLNSMTIGNSVTSIGNSAFNGCRSLRSLTFEDGEPPVSLGYNTYSSSNGKGLFADCPLENIYIGRNLSYNSTSSYGYSPFAKNTTLNKVTIGDKVTSFPDYFLYGCSGLTSIIISNSVSSFGNYAFYNCSGLTDFTIPDSVSSIGNYAFYNCSGLTSINIPNSVISIGGEAFRYCSGLTNVVIGNSVTLIKNLTFDSCSGLTSVTISSSVSEIGNGAFQGCSSLSSVILKDGETTIKLGYYSLSSTSGKGLFADCPLENIYIGRNLSYETYGSASPFSKISTLTTVTIGENVTSLPDYLLNECSRLTGITIPNSVTEIGDNVFRGCSSLNSVTLEYGETPIELGYCTTTYNGKGLFADCPLENIYIGRNLSYSPGYSYGLSPFANNKTLTEVRICDNISSLPDYLLYGCDGLTSIIIPNSVTSIGNYAFYNCAGLSSIEIPNSVISIGEKAFEDCSGLTNVVIGNSVTSIGDYAFSGCTGLTNLVIGNSVTSIGSSTFSHCSLNEIALSQTNPPSFYPIFSSYVNQATLLIPDNTLFAYLASDWRNFLKIEEENGNKVYVGNDDVFTYRFFESSHEAVLIQSNTYSSMTSVSIPDRVVCDLFGSEAFYKVTVIDDNAFSNCSKIKQIKLPANLSIIGEYAFNGCTGLTSIEIPNSVTSIGNSAFSDCTGLTSLTMGNSVETIGKNAFARCGNITSIAIPRSVTSIGSDAFWYCGIRKVEIEDLAAWCKIDFEDAWANPFCNAGTPYINGEKITNLTIPADITSIRNYTFFYWWDLTNVTFHNSVTSIGDCSFSHCSGLSGIAIPNSVTSIGKYAFSDCTGLTSIEIPNSVISIEPATFSECTGLTSVVIGNSVTSIGEQAFSGCSGLTAIEIPNSVTSIGDYAFMGCSGLANLAIPNSVTSIGNYAFYDCPGITEINIPESLTHLGRSAFYTGENLSTVRYNAIDCKFDNLDDESAYYTFNPNINNLVIGENVKTIPQYFVPKSKNIKELIIPNSVISIGASAFWDCSGMTNLEIGSSVKNIGKQVFNGCDSLISLIFKDGMEDLIIESGEKFPVSTLYLGRNITGQSSFPNLETLNIGCFVNYIPANTYNIESLTSITINPGGEVVIEAGAFRGCRNLAELTLPEDIAEIGANAFSGTALKNITVPGGVIGNNAFANCNLNNIILGKDVESIGEKAFDGSNAIKNVYATPTTPPAAQNNTFSYYEAQLWVPEEAIDTYYNFTRCWYRFNGKPLVCPENIVVTGPASFSGKPGETLQLTATIAPSNVTLDRVLWRSTNPAVATVDNNGLVTILNLQYADEATARAQEEGFCQIIASTLYEESPVAVVNIEVSEGETSSIEYINPEDESVGSNGIYNQNDIYTLQGVCVKRQASQSDIDALSPGIYIIGGKKVIVK